MSTEERIVEVRPQTLVGTVLSPGDVIILTFGTDDGPRRRTDPVTATGSSINLSSVVRVSLPGRAKALNAELHLIIGDNKTRIIGKGKLDLTHGLIPRINNGHIAAEVVTRCAPSEMFPSRRVLVPVLSHLRAWAGFRSPWHQGQDHRPAQTRNQNDHA